MTLLITVEGGFELQPPATREAQAVIAHKGRGWRTSEDGRVLYLPEAHPRPFRRFDYLVTVVLPELGITATGSATWRRDDRRTGWVNIAGRFVEGITPLEEVSAPELRLYLGDLRDGPRTRRLESLEALEVFQVARPSVIKAVARVLADPDQELRLRAARLLGILGPDASPAVAALGRALDHDDPETQAAAVKALVAIGPAAIRALPALARIASSPSYGLVWLAHEAIGLICGDPVRDGAVHI